MLDEHQDTSQLGFRPGMRLENAFATIEGLLSNCHEHHTDLWIASLDMRKAFDRVEFSALFRALRMYGLDEPHLNLIACLYANQHASVDGSSAFRIQRGVKQGDIISPLLFNIALQLAFDNWKLNHLGHHGWLLNDSLERLSNTRYADDILVYAKSLAELQSMVESLLSELKAIGLDPNATKTKILTTNEHYSLNASFIDIDGEFIDVVPSNAAHKYLGRMLSLDASKRVGLEVSFRKRCAWSAFHKHRKTLLNHDISLALRLKLFDAVVTPSALFCIHVLPLTKSQRSSIGACQRRMIRSICGWRRIADEDWSETMRRMKHRVQIGMQLHYVRGWEEQILRSQWSYAVYLSQCQQTTPWCVTTHWNISHQYDPHLPHQPRRLPGRPRKRWDDDLRHFVHAKFNSRGSWLWSASVNYSEFKASADEFVVWVMAQDEIGNLD